MMTLSPDVFESLLADTAQAYLTTAHALDPETSGRVARDAARRVVDGLRPATVQQAYPEVISVARGMALDLPGRTNAPDGPRMPARQGRPMRLQPLDPLTLADLSDRSRDKGRRLVERLPDTRDVVRACTAFAIVLLALSSPTG